MRTKHIIATVALFAALVIRSMAASPEAETRFLADAKAALDTKNSTNLLKLVCWDGVAPEMKKMIEQQMSFLVQRPVTQIELLAPAPKQKIEYTRDGVTYRPNLAVIKQLKITFKADKPVTASSAELPVGEKDGRLFITTAAPAK
jgi:hypothetical protein